MNNYKQTCLTLLNKAAKKYQTLIRKDFIIESANINTQTPMRLPDLKIIIIGTKYGYKREDGVFVIPLACLKP